MHTFEGLLSVPLACEAFAARIPLAFEYLMLVSSNKALWVVSCIESPVLQEFIFSDITFDELAFLFGIHIFDFFHIFILCIRFIKSRNIIRSKVM